MKSIKCPKENGGCGSDHSWRVAMNQRYKRLEMECCKCGYRTGFFLDMDKLSEHYHGPLDETGKEFKRL